MKKTTSSVAFYCRESKANKQGYAPIELALTINGERVFINTPRKEKPELYKKAIESKKGNEIKEYCDLMRGKVNIAMNDLISHSLPITTASIREYIQSGGIKSYTVKDLFEGYLAILKTRVGSSLTSGVYRKYELVYEQFKRYVKETDECSLITPALIQQVFADMYAKYDKSTAAGYMTKLKTFITYGIDNNKISINPFQNIKIEKGHKPIDYLTEEEIEILKNAPIENESLSRVRDCAVFQIASGIAYCDVLSLEPDDLKCENGTYYINKRRQKTGTEYFSIVLPVGVEIFKKYGGKLPMISNQKYNMMLKTIGAICGLKTSLHSHLFRHSYCTMLLNRGVPLKTVSRCAGHSNSKITEAFYAHLHNSTIISEVSAVF